MEHNKEFIEGFAEGCGGLSIESAIATWEWFCEKNPCDPENIERGGYEAGEREGMGCYYEYFS